MNFLDKILFSESIVDENIIQDATKYAHEDLREIEDLVAEKIDDRIKLSQQSIKSVELDMQDGEIGVDSNELIEMQTYALSVVKLFADLLENEIESNLYKWRKDVLSVSSAIQNNKLVSQSVKDEIKKYQDIISKTFNI